MDGHQPPTSLAAARGRPGRLARFLGGLAVVVGATLVTLLLCEGAARLIFPPIRGLHWYHYDPRYTMRNRADMAAATTDWGDGGMWRFRTNAHGFRGDDWPAMPPPGTRRVLVMGDSFTFGNGVDEGGAYPEVADRLLRAHAPDGQRWEVLDLGVSAWGPQNALAYLETEGAGIGASCLVYGFFLGNDVMDNVSYGLYGMRDGRLERNPVTPAADSPMKRIRDLVDRMPGYDFLIRHSQLVNLARHAVIAALADYGWMKEALYVPPDRYARALDLNDATLDRMAAVARRRFGHFALLLIPPLDELMVRPRPQYSAALADEARARVRRWAAAHAVPVLDLVDILPHDARAAALYFKRDFHMNAAGYRRVGEALARRLPQLCPGGQSK